ncbi:golgin subfamily A member 6-like protein 6 [Rana temporaria]|uniref:golgin subfamily A member 6-like protein 6 n=1 Tax=Rana temporaria TaxID=8407 RepID=UPI001AAC8D78|nr:golgin subfamily A member 6-like protein 6 [Rana temporaria]
MKKVLLKSRDLTGVYPIVVLTHKTSGNLTDTENAFRDMGMERIFSFENYTKEDHMKTRGRHEEVLKFLCEVIKDVQFRIEHRPHDPAKEIMERKTFVMNYIHEYAKKVQEEKIERQRAMEKVQQEKKKKEQEEQMNRQREREKQDQANELKWRQEELERQRQAELARQEEQLRAAQEKLQKKKKKKWGIFG